MEQQMLIPFRVNRAHHNLQFFVAHDRVAALRVQFGDQVAQRRDQRVGLRNDLVALQAEVAVQPVRHARCAGRSIGSVVCWMTLSLTAFIGSYLLDVLKILHPYIKHTVWSCLGGTFLKSFF